MVDGPTAESGEQSGKILPSVSVTAVGCREGYRRKFWRRRQGHYGKGTHSQRWCAISDLAYHGLFIGSSAKELLEIVTFFIVFFLATFLAKGR